MGSNVRPKRETAHERGAFHVLKGVMGGLLHAMGGLLHAMGGYQGGCRGGYRRPCAPRLMIWVQHQSNSQLGIQ